MEAFLTLVWFLAGATAGWWLTSLRLARTASLGREQMRTQMHTSPVFLSALGIPVAVHRHPDNLRSRRSQILGKAGLITSALRR